MYTILFFPSILQIAPKGARNGFDESNLYIDHAEEFGVASTIGTGIRIFSQKIEEKMSLRVPIFNREQAVVKAKNDSDPFSISNNLLHQF